MTRTLKFFIFTFIFLFCAAATQLHAQEAARERGGHQGGRGRQADPGNAPAQNLGSSYSAFYKKVYDECESTVKSVGEELGHPQGPQCETVLQACLNANFLCFQKNAQCGITTLQDGTRGIHCEKPTTECRGEATEFVMALIASRPDECGTIGPDLSAPGCGNQVKEIGEDCDAGADNGQPNSSCNAECKKPGTPEAPPTPKCGNHTTEDGEECDAGTDNGKQSAGCDIECKKFVTAEATVPTPAQNIPSPTPPAAAGCHMTQGKQSMGSGPMIMVLFAGMGLLLGSRFRKRQDAF